LSVLRVLSEQTLEISKEVKYSSVPDPSLAKVVKDSTLTILFIQISFNSVLWSKGTVLRFLQDWGALSRKRSSIWLEDIGFEVDLATECFPSLGDFSHQFLGVYHSIFIYSQAGRISEGGRTCP
jgi:hypothetical protein